MKVNKAIYVIVALFLGGLGIHKFYADKFGQGVFSLIIFLQVPYHHLINIHAIFCHFYVKKQIKMG